MDEAFVARFSREHINPMQRLLWNKVHLRDGFTQKTCKATIDIAYWLWDNGYDFACEVRMNNGLRADFIVPCLYGSQCIEVMDSEGIDSIEKKADKYTCTFLAVPANLEEAVLLIRAANGLK